MKQLIFLEAASFDWSSVKFDGVYNEVVKVLPFVIPAVLMFIGLRKAWGFVAGSLRRA